MRVSDLHHLQAKLLLKSKVAEDSYEKKVCPLDY
jgi:hypothetical protein